ncbi:Rib/alpha-like domain-containing protein [Dolosigranulum pigrum]|uniref:YSIRK-type signal peptide-containing protein n=1 Tax=Dolosigranulum pigrum TaxID=29394 RepID=A0A516GK73_9LACT|nr:Rib/alpha-like domain-containing protein [Dolosigranulum pigrum]QDO91922.1 YSIRK-type signal peptide-containing protein [Dolosigranulum pigrum]
MVGKNNKQARWSKSANTFKRYSLKKLSVGVASVVIGTGVAWASSTTVHAAEEGTEVVTGDGEKEEPVESAVPTEAPVVDGDESSSHDAVADLVNQIKAAEEPASEAADAVEPRGANESSDNDYEPIPSDAIEGAAETSDEEKDATSKPTSDDADELESDEEESRIQPRSSRTRAAGNAEDESAEADKLAGKYQPYVGSTLAKAQFKRVPEALEYIQNREDLKKDGQSVIKSAEWVDKEVFKKAGRQSTKIKVTYTDGSEDIVDIRLLINNGYKIGNQEYTGTKASEMFGLQTEKDGNIALGLNTPDARQKEVRDKKSIEFEITTQMGFNRAGRNEYAYFELSDNLARHVTSVVDTTNSEDSIPWERVRSHTGALTNTWRKKYATGPAKARRGEALFNGAVPTVSQTAKVRFDLKKTLGEIIKQENITKNSDIQAEVFVYNEDKARAKNGTHIHQNVLVKDRYGNNVPDSTKAADSIRSSAINSYFDKNIGPNGAFVFDHHFNKKVLNINNHPHQYQYHYKIDERLAPYISDTKVYYLNDGGSGLDFRENAENSDELRKVFENEGPERKRNGWSGFEAQYNNGQRTNSWITKGTEIVENPQGHNFGIDRQLNTGEGYYRLTNWLANPLSRQMNFLNSSALNAGTRVAFLLKEGQKLDDVLRAFRGEKFTYEGFLKLTAKDGNIQPGTRGSGYYEVLDLDGDGRADEATPYDSNISIDTTYENANKITGSALSGIKSATSDNANDGAPLSVYRVLKNGQREKIGETKVKANGTYEISVPEGKQLQKDDVLEVEAVDNEGKTVRNRTTVLPLPDNQKYEPTGKNGEVPKNSQPVAEDFINKTYTNDKGVEVTLPDNSKYDWEKPVDTSTTGEKDGTVIVTYPDGTQDKVNVKVTVVEGSKKADEVEPKYENPSSGSLKSDEPKFHAQGNPDEQKDKPANTRFGKGKNAPEGVSVDSETGVVTLDNPVTVETKVPVEVTYEDGSTDTTSVTFTPEKPVADDLGYPEEVTIEETDEGSARTKQTGEPNLPDAVNKANGDKFRFNKDVPEGFTHGNDNGTELVFNGGTADDPSDDVTLTIDPNTGNITVKGEDKADTRKPFDIPVEYVSEDGKLKGSDVVSVQVKPKAEAETPAPSIERAETPTHVTEGEEKALEDKVNNPTDGMTGTITDGEGNEIQGGTVTVDGNTGEIKVQVPTNTVPEDQDSIPGKVQIKDNNGNDVGGPIDITIDKAKEETPAPSIERAETPTHVTEGEEKALEDKVNNPTDGMTGTITDGEGNEIQGGTVTVDGNTGEIKVQVPTNTVPEDQDSIPGKVQIKDNNGNDVGGPIDITIDKAKEETPAPSIERAETPTHVTEGEEKALEDKVNNPTDGMTGTITDGEGNEIQGGTVTVDGNTGEIKVQVPTNTVPEGQDSIPGKVQIKDNNGNDVGNPIDITIDKAKDETPAPSISGYEDKTITEGRPIEPITPEITNKGEGDITENGLPDGLNINPETGEITGTPDVKDWKDNFDKEKPNSSDFEEERDFTVTVTVPGQPERTAEFTITVQRDTDGDGIADVNDPDSDGDGINDNVELERGTNPKDANDFKGPELSVNTPKKDEETVSGKTEPDTPVTVKDTDGKIIGQGVSDEEGNFKVPVERPLKGGEELDVTAGDPNTENDQTTDRVTVYTPQSDIYEPQGNPIFVEKNGTPNATDGIANKDELPEGTKFEFDGPVDTSTPGKKDVNVKITYPDGSEESITVPLHVSDEDTPQSEIFEPRGQDIEVPEGAELDAANGIANKDELPEGTEFEFDGPVDTSTPGEKKAKVIVAYPDGSTDTVDITVNVTEVPTQADKHEPKGQDIEVPEGAEPDAANGIANKDELPEGTEFEFDGPVDTSTPGEKKAKVIVAYPDGSTDTVDITVNVTEVPTQANNHEPQGNPIFVEKNGTPNAADGIANKDELPEGTEFEFDGPVDTSTPGEKKAKVIVAYPDGSTDTVDVTVNVTDGDTPQSEIFEPQGQDIEVPEGGQPNAADGIANKDELPEGTEFEFDGPVDTSTPGKKKAKVIVAYPDGSTDTVDVTVNVTPKAPGKTTAETLEPKWNDSDAKDGGPVTVPNTGDKIPAGSKTTATITEDPNNKGKAKWTATVGEDGSVTVTPGADAQPGDSATVTVETTYPDGSKDSSSFKVTVPAVGPTHAHGDSLVHDKPSYDLDKLGHGQTQPSRPAEDKGQGQVQDKAQTPAVDKAGLPNYVPSQSGERLPDTATGAWVLGVVGLMSTGLGSALGLKRKKEDEE